MMQDTYKTVKAIFDYIQKSVNTQGFEVPSIRNAYITIIVTPCHLIKLCLKEISF